LNQTPFLFFASTERKFRVARDRRRAISRGQKGRTPFLMSLYGDEGAAQAFYHYNIERGLLYSKNF